MKNEDLTEEEFKFVKAIREAAGYTEGEKALISAIRKAGIATVNEDEGLIVPNGQGGQMIVWCAGIPATVKNTDYLNDIRQALKLIKAEKE